MPESLKIIHECRKKISLIDEKIFSMIKERERLSAQIGEAKRSLNIADKDFKREKEVFDQAIKRAQELCLPQKLVVSLQKTLMEISLARQQQDRIKYHVSENPLAVLIVGGSGRMGKWFCNFFSDCGHNVSIVDTAKPDFDCPYSNNMDDFINESDLIVISTPIRATKNILENLATKNLKNKYVFDISSIKALVKEPLMKLKEHGVNVTSLHPMFGPFVEYLFGKQIIRTSLGDTKADELAADLFKSTSVALVDMSFDEHDEVCSYLLSLSHLINLVLVTALRDSPHKMSFLQKFSSTTFKNQMEIAKRVFKENPQLYFEIQAFNPHNQKAFGKLKASLDNILEFIENKDEAGFVMNMKKGQEYIFAEHGENE